MSQAVAVHHSVLCSFREKKHPRDKKNLRPLKKTKIVVLMASGGFSVNGVVREMP